MVNAADALLLGAVVSLAASVYLFVLAIGLVNRAMAQATGPSESVRILHAGTLPILFVPFLLMFPVVESWY